VKHKLIRGLALTLGVCTVPGIASAQYTIGTPTVGGASAPTGTVGSGLSGGAYLPLTPPSVTIPQVTVPQVTVPQVTVPQVTVPQVSIPQVQSNQTFSLPTSAPTATYSPVGYQQNGAVGTGVQVGAADISSANPYGNPASLLSQPAAPQEVVSPQSVGQSAVAYDHNHVDGNCSTCGTGTVDTSCGASSCNLTTQTLCPWIFGANALLFNRVDDEYTRLSYDSNMPTDSLLSTSDVRIRQQADTN